MMTNMATSTLNATTNTIRRAALRYALVRPASFGTGCTSSTLAISLGTSTYQLGAQIACDPFPFPISYRQHYSNVRSPSSGPTGFARFFALSP